MDLVHVGERQAQKLLLVPPFHLALCKLAALGRRRRRIRDLGDEVRRALDQGQPCLSLQKSETKRTHSLSNAIKQDPQQRHADQGVDANRKPKQQPLAAAEPLLLLVLGKVHARKVGLQQLAHQAARGKVALQKDDKIPPREEDAGAEDERGRTEPDGLVEGPEAGGREHQPADAGEVRGAKHGERDEALAREADEELGQGLGGARGLGAAVALGVLS